MTDQLKRQTLKLMAGSVVVNKLIQSDSAKASTLTTSQSAGVSANVATRGELDITIIHSTDVTEDSLILSNLSDQPIIIDGFAGGTVVFKDKQVNLSLLAHPLSQRSKVLQIDAHSHLALQIDVVHRGNDDNIVEYLWAEDATSTLPAGTHVVSLGAFMAGQIAVLFTRSELAHS